MSSSWITNKADLQQPLDEDWPLLLALYATMIVPAAALALVEGSAVFLFMVTAMCGAHAVLAGPNGEPLLGTRPANVLAAVLLLVFARMADMEALRFGYTPVHFIMCLQVLKLFGQHRMRDVRIIQFISLFELLVAARWAQTLSFMGIFVLSVGVLLLHSMMLATRPVGGVRVRRRSRMRDLAAAFRLPGLLLLVFCVVFFVAFPRFRVNAARGGLVMGRRTGFTDEVSLKEIGRMRESRNVALRVRFFEAGNQDVPIMAPRSLMRGTTYTRYEDGGWSSPPQPFRSDQELDSEMAMEPSRLMDAAGVPVRYIRQRVILEAATGTILFGLYLPLQADADPGSARVRPMSYEITRTGRARMGRAINYEVLSKVPDWPQEDLLRAGTPDIQDGYELFWQYPEELEPVLRSTIQDIRDRNEPQTDLARVQAVEAYLGNPQNYLYSLDLPPYGAMDPVEAFLRETRVGSCEQFASAMVLLLRAWGIPARLVGGFKGGARSEDSATYIFRDSDAHAWVEVYFSGLGWVEFDPTPGSASAGLGDMMGSGERTGLLTRMYNAPANLLRQTEVAWRVYILNYGPDQQDDMMESLRAAMAELSESLPGGSGSAEGMLRGLPTLIGLALVIFVAAVSLHLLLGMIAGRRAARRRRYQVEGYYGDMLQLLRRRGLERAAHDTPREFAGRARARLQAAENVPEGSMGAVEELTELFCRRRYGAQTLSPEENKRATQALGKLRGLPKL